MPERSSRDRGRVDALCAHRCRPFGPPCRLGRGAQPEAPRRSLGGAQSGRSWGSVEYQLSSQCFAGHSRFALASPRLMPRSGAETDRIWGTARGGARSDSVELVPGDEEWGAAPAPAAAAAGAATAPAATVEDTPAKGIPRAGLFRYGTRPEDVFPYHPSIYKSDVPQLRREVCALPATPTARSQADAPPPRRGEAASRSPDSWFLVRPQVFAGVTVACAQVGTPTPASPRLCRSPPYARRALQLSDSMAMHPRPLDVRRPRRHRIRLLGRWRSLSRGCARSAGNPLELDFLFPIVPGPSNPASHLRSVRVVPCEVAEEQSEEAGFEDEKERE